MNEVFDAYAAYYDLLYREKDYAGEAAYVSELIRHHTPDANAILELGCGIGSHAREFAKLGYTVTGIDRSPAMVSQANERVEPSAGTPAPTFAEGDLRNFRAGRTFDVVLALFHVMSYQTSNSDLSSAMTTAAAHLQPGGLFIFDCWYGPGVLTDLPITRVRRLEGDGTTVTRIAEPIHHPNTNCVDVQYEVLVEQASGINRINEVHSMRYLFAPEIDVLLRAAGLSRLALKAWLGHSEPTLHTWNGCFVAKKNS